LPNAASTVESPAVLATLDPSEKPDVFALYDEFLHHISVLDDHQTAYVERDALAKFLTQPAIFVTIASIAASTSLDRLFATFGTFEFPCQLMVKSILPSWLSRILARTLATQYCRIRVGFYVAPNPSIFRAIYQQTVLPESFMNSAIEASYEGALSKATSGVKPILVALPAENDGDVMPFEMLPLGVATDD